MEELELECFGIVITFEHDDKECAQIKSTMKDHPETEENKAFNSGVEAIETMILEHFIVGIDVSSPEYLVGIESAFNSLSHNFN